MRYQQIGSFVFFPLNMDESLLLYLLIRFFPNSRDIGPASLTFTTRAQFSSLAKVLLKMLITLHHRIS